MEQIRRKAAFVLRREEIDRYIDQIKAEGLGQGTIRKYRRMLLEFYEALPGEKQVTRDTFPEYLQEAAEKYSTSSLNSLISAFNNLMLSLDRGEFQVPHLPKQEELVQPELSREEYFRLLREARSQDRREGYLLVKLFANTDLRVGEIGAVTAEAVRAGALPDREGKPLRFPALLRRELLYYMDLEDISAGPIFRTRGGGVLDRVAIHRIIAELGRRAGLPKEKANPRCLHRLYSSTMEQLVGKYQPMIDQGYDQLMETEQLLVAWNDSATAS